VKKPQTKNTFPKTSGKAAQNGSEYAIRKFRESE
jgi:hypothetical protein